MPPHEFNIRAAKPKPDEEQESFLINVYDVNDEWAAKEEFQLLDYIPVAPTLVLAGALDGRGGIREAAFDGLIRSMLIPEDQSRWILLVTNPELRIEAKELEPIVRWLIEKVMGHPTGGPSDSSDGPSTSGTGSTDDAPSPALIP